MNLYNALHNIKKQHGLHEKTVLKIVCTDGQILRGTYCNYVQALDNEPEIAEVDIRDLRTTGLIGILETEIDSISVE
ncbi:MAG: hypothetical protein LKE53_04940 [Oscillospiraceae bacterium]|jgi:hypothetical protein|nr:hypothetical protein [Oscillospiraceae bacterium]